MIPTVNIKDYHFELPTKKIALYPLKNRDESKLLVVDRTQQSVGDNNFYNLHNVIDDNYHLVVNNTKVIPARFYLKRKNEKIVEIFCLNPVLPSIDPQISLIEKNTVVWNCILKGKKIKPGDKFTNFSDSVTSLQAEVLDIIDSHFEIKFEWDEDLSFFEIIQILGSIPLPPYIERERESEEIDKDRYQTVFAKENGSVAAPTAALHFTEEVFKNLKKKNIKISEVLLHVGSGTFKPIFTDTVNEHPMHEEFFSVSIKLIIDLIASVKKGKKILAVGTTSVRTLESLMIFAEKLSLGYKGKVYIEQWEAYEYNPVDKLKLLEILKDYLIKNDFTKIIGYTQLCIIPSYRFRIIDSMITNFHQPYSTLILLLAAFMGKDLWHKSYEHALNNDYRFLSYGDSSIIL